MRLELVVGADTPTLSAGGWIPHYKYSEKLQAVEQLGACRQLVKPIERNYYATKQQARQLIIYHDEECTI